jgi:predicted lipid-binding transport protein (Tim44 family)
MRQSLAELGPQGAQVFGALFATIKVGLVAALHDVFLLGAVLAVFGVITVLFMKELPLTKSYAQPQAADASTDTSAQVGHDAYPSLPQRRPSDAPPAQAPVRVPTLLPVPSPGERAERGRAAG